MSAELTLLHRINDLLAPATPVADRIAALSDPTWQIRQAALNGLCVSPDAAAIPAIAACLVDHDQRDLYGPADQWSLEGSKDAQQLDDWRCRFRVKQAACHALAAIAATGATVPAELSATLCGYATNADEDYPVRAAACQTLAHIPTPAAQDALTTAAQDTEWCTAASARRALAHHTA